MINKGKILIVDDDKFILLSLRMFLDNHFEEVQTTNDPSKIPDIISKTSFNTILLDMNFKKGDTSGDDGIFWLRKIKEADSSMSVIMITAYGEIQKAVRAIKAGALDFIVKPWENEKLLPTIITATNLSLSQQKIKQLKSRQHFIEHKGSENNTGIIGESPTILDLIDQINKIALTDANILIYGENGTGKEIVAQNIHQKSQQAKEVIINVDLGSISESLFESELFGHVKGSFTNAHEDRIGRFEAASGGSLFLDEISNLPLHLQSKLLKAIQEKQISKVGSNKIIDVDIRLICASNQPLRQLVDEGKFRQDLLYRINTVEINIPPLRERSEDIPLLAEHFLRIFKRKYHKNNLQLPEYVCKKLQKFHWPGNVRELQHAIERAVIMSESTILKSNDFIFLTPNKNSQKHITEDFNLNSIEKTAIEECIKKHGGNLTKAALELGLTRGALYRRIEKYDI